MTSTVLPALLVLVLAIGLVYGLHRATSTDRPRSTPGPLARSSAMPGRSVRFHRWPGEHAGLPRHCASFGAAGGGRYALVFVQLPDRRCRAYIRRAPSYGVRSSSLLMTHRKTDSRGRAYICFEPEPREPSQLLTVAAAWMAATDTYRRTGVFTPPAWAR